MPFDDIGATAAAVDDGAAETAEIDLALDNVNVIPGSLCMACGASGETRIMMTKIPLFREVILSSFACESCGERNTEVQFGGETQEKGCRFRLTCAGSDDLDRQVVKSESCKVLVPSLELEIPAATQRGVVTTVEGVLSRAADELAALQPQRLAADVDVGRRVQLVIDALRDHAAGEAFPFDVVVDDPAGNSFVQPLGEPDPQLASSTYDRSDADLVALGFRPGGAAPVSEDAAPAARLPQKRVEGVADLLETPAEDREVMAFRVACPHCGKEGDEHMCVAKIPYFKECVIMSFSCAHCGYRNSEVKGGGAVPLKGCLATLTCVDAGDLSRDVLKSDTAALAIPELDLELAHGSLGSVYTTLEGVLDKVADGLRKGNPFADSLDQERRSQFAAFVGRVEALRDGRTFPFTVVLRDPLANSFVGPRRDAALVRAEADPLSEFSEADVPSSDPQLRVEDFDRTFEENEELGLNDIATGELEAVAEGSEDDLPRVDGLDLDATRAVGVADHVRPAPRTTLDHPNPNFAKGCDD